MIDARRILEARLAEMTQRFEGSKTIELPPHWGGYRIVPATIEFWQGRSNRLHDRFRYTRQKDGSWLLERLAPWFVRLRRSSQTEDAPAPSRDAAGNTNSRLELKRNAGETGTAGSRLDAATAEGEDARVVFLVREIGEVAKDADVLGDVDTRPRD